MSAELVMQEGRKRLGPGLPPARQHVAVKAQSVDRMAGPGKEEKGSSWPPPGIQPRPPRHYHGGGARRALMAPAPDQEKGSSWPGREVSIGAPVVKLIGKSSGPCMPGVGPAVQVYFESLGLGTGLDLAGMYDSEADLREALLHKLGPEDIDSAALCWHWACRASAGDVTAVVAAVLPGLGVPQLRPPPPRVQGRGGSQVSRGWLALPQEVEKTPAVVSAGGF